jgi:2-polyprenyl-6-methoxyphenol hydroxylase-like FAD-dependent oxidoreductase
MKPRINSHHDVVIVGARAAGSATARLLADLGHDVAVVDRAELPSDTISTHQVARTGVVALHRWGLLDTVIASGTPPLRQVTFDGAEGRRTFTIKDKSGVDCLVAPRRYVLDTLLAEAARHSGATLHMGVSVTDVTRDASGRATGVCGLDRDGEPVQLRGRFVIGADGLNSRVARSVGAPIVVDGGATGAVLYAYFAGMPWPAVEYITRPRTYAGVFPTHHGEAAIWVCGPASTVRAARLGRSPEAAFEALLHTAAPELAQRLREARRTSPVRGMWRAPNQIRCGIGAGWALVGDAASHRDPVTGHGLSEAFRDAELLAVGLDAALRGDLEEPVALATYEHSRRREMAEIFELTRRIAAYPSVAEFSELTRSLGAAIDSAAAALAARPVPGALAMAGDR